VGADAAVRVAAVRAAVAQVRTSSRMKDESGKMKKDFVHTSSLIFHLFFGED
jgi:hypothetical protein